MTNVTIKKLAKELGTTTTKILEYAKNEGFKKQDSDQTLNDGEQQLIRKIVAINKNSKLKLEASSSKKTTLSFTKKSGGSIVRKKITNKDKEKLIKKLQEKKIEDDLQKIVLATKNEVKLNDDQEKTKHNQKSEKVKEQKTEKNNSLAMILNKKKELGKNSIFQIVEKSKNEKDLKSKSVKNEKISIDPKLKSSLSNISKVNINKLTNKPIKNLKQDVSNEAKKQAVRLEDLNTSKNKKTSNKKHKTKILDKEIKLEEKANSNKKEQLIEELETNKKSDSKKKKYITNEETNKFINTSKLKEQAYSADSIISNFKIIAPSIEENFDLRKEVKLNNKHSFSKPVNVKEKIVKVSENMTVGEFAKVLAIKSSKIIKILMKLGEITNINMPLDGDTMQLVANELKKEIIIEQDSFEEDIFNLQQLEGDIKKRPPVVTIMGHVDHGKTSLLDYIKNTKIVSQEAGGITQHMAAYNVNTNKGEITFLDTPGHSAFTAMRARGTSVTDIVVLIVAGDDGVMPQTREAVEHAKSANVPIIVAITKIDKIENIEVNIEKIKSELSSFEIIAEDWGGDTQFVKISSHTGEGVDGLLDSIAIQAEILNLQASHNQRAQGVILESHIEKGRGIICTGILKNGVMKKGDTILTGNMITKSRLLIDEFGKAIKQATPSIPFEILGFDKIPSAGDKFAVINDKEKSKVLSLIATKKEKEKMQKASNFAKSAFDKLGKEDVKTANIIIKADTNGSLEAIAGSINNIETEINLKIISSGVGSISETDVMLAKVSDAVIIGFNVRADSKVKDIINKENIDVRYYGIIYNLIDDITKLINGMISPKFEEKILGTAKVKDVFKSPKFGLIAGCIVSEGSIIRNKSVRVLRDNIVIFEGEIDSLRRFKDNVAEVKAGIECGIGIKNYKDIKADDQIEVFDFASNLK